MKKIIKRVIPLALSFMLCISFIAPLTVFAVSDDQNEENLTYISGTLTINGFTEQQLKDPDLYVYIRMYNPISLEMYNYDHIYENLSDDPFNFEFAVAKGLYFIDIYVENYETGIKSSTNIRFHAKGENDEEKLDINLYPVKGRITFDRDIDFESPINFSVFNKHIEYENRFELVYENYEFYCGNFGLFATEEENIYEYFWFAPHPGEYFILYTDKNEDLLISDSSFPFTVAEEFDNTVKPNANISVKELTHIIILNKEIESLTITSPSDLGDGEYIIDSNVILFYDYPLDEEIVINVSSSCSHLLETEFVINPDNNYVYEFCFDEKPFDCNVTGTINIEGINSSEIEGYICFRDFDNYYNEFYTEIEISDSNDYIATYNTYLPEGRYNLFFEGFYSHGDYDMYYHGSYIGSFEITSNNNEINIDLKKITGKINFLSTPPSPYQDLSLIIEDIEHSVTLLAKYYENTLYYEAFLQYEGKYTLNATQDLTGCVAEESDTIDFTYSGEAIELADINAVVGNAIMYGINYFQYNFLPFVPFEKLIILEAPEGVQLHEKTIAINYDMLGSKSAKKSSDKSISFVLNYYVITGLQYNDKIKLEGYVDNPALKTTILEFTYTGSGGYDVEKFLFYFDINKTNQEASEFVPDNNATEPYTLNISGSSVYIPYDSLLNLAENNGKNGIKYTLDNVSILFSGNNLSNLSGHFRDFGVALKIKDDSFLDAKAVLDKLVENTGNEKKFEKASDKALLFQIGNIAALNENTLITVNKDDLGLGDIDYSKVNAYFHNPDNSSFTKLQTLFNPDYNSISFETDKTGYFVFGLEHETVTDPPDNNEPDDNEPDDNEPNDNNPINPNTGDNVLINIVFEFCMISGVAVLILFSKKKMLILKNK